MTLEVKKRMVEVVSSGKGPRELYRKVTKRCRSVKAPTPKDLTGNEENVACWKLCRDIR